MKRSTIVVIGLIVALLGVAGLIIERVPYDEDEATLRVGELEASASVEEEAEIPPVLAGGVLVLGLGIAGYGVARD